VYLYIRSHKGSPRRGGRGSSPHIGVPRALNTRRGRSNGVPGGQLKGIIPGPRPPGTPPGPPPNPPPWRPSGPPLAPLAPTRILVCCGLLNGGIWAGEAARKAGNGRLEGGPPEGGRQGGLQGVPGILPSCPSVHLKLRLRAGGLRAVLACTGRSQWGPPGACEDPTGSARACARARSRAQTTHSFLISSAHPRLTETLSFRRNESEAFDLRSKDQYVERRSAN